MSGTKNRKFIFIISHFVLMCGCLATTYPLLRIFSVSLRPGNRLLSTDLSFIPEGASFASYFDVLADTNFLLWLFNSVLITIITSLLGLILAVSAAYAFSRFRFPGKKLGLFSLMLTQMIPACMLVLPLYIMLIKLHLINTYLGLIIAYSVTGLPFTIWILKGYFDTVPYSLEESAQVDGTTVIGAFYRIILPLSTPALSIAFLFNFSMAWNEYLVARVVIQKADLYTWPLGLFELQGSFDTKWGMFAAASIMISIPLMALFMYSSRWLLSGMTMGSVKG